MKEPKTWTSPEPWTRYTVTLWKAKTGPGETLPNCYKSLVISSERVTVETVDPREMLEAWKQKATGDPAQLAEELNVKELLSA